MQGIAGLLICLVLVSIRTGSVTAMTCDEDPCEAGEFCCNFDMPMMCAECCDDRHCAGDIPVCNKATQKCVGCLTDGDCEAPTPVCNAALECEAACTVGGACPAGQVCDVHQGQCVCSGDGKLCNGPNQACKANMLCDCVSGFVQSIGGLCIPDCSPVCQGGQVCTMDGQCVCPAGFVEGINGVCVECLPECIVDADCQNVGEICMDNRCVCPTTPTAFKLYRGKCVAQGMLGGWCLPNARCKEKRVKCDTATNMCKCTGNCQPTNVCLGN